MYSSARGGCWLATGLFIDFPERCMGRQGICMSGAVVILCWHLATWFRYILGVASRYILWGCITPPKILRTVRPRNLKVKLLVGRGHRLVRPFYSCPVPWWVLGRRCGLKVVVFLMTSVDSICLFLISLLLTFRLFPQIPVVWQCTLIQADWLVSFGGIVEW